jgi:anti-anti-sigma factor
MDLATVSRLAAALDPARVERGGIVEVDLAPCTFVDSSVVAALVRADEHLRARGATLVVVVAPGPVRRTLEITGVLTMLRVVDGAALRILPGRPPGV